MNNFNKFIGPIKRSGINYLIIDCAFGTQSFNLRKSDRIIRVRTPHVLWQKERLLNIAISHLPINCQKVAWVDCDILFENPEWTVETSKKLDHFQVVQPFCNAIRLEKNERYFVGKALGEPSFASVFANDPLAVRDGRFDKHGHPGYAWAARKSYLQDFGLYDCCIAGSADHVMAHAFVEAWNTPCIERVFGDNITHRDHYIEWAKKIGDCINSNISYCNGTILHLWHGEIKNRKYTEREKMLQLFNFNPKIDIEMNQDHCWIWKRPESEIKKWMDDYFYKRLED